MATVTKVGTGGVGKRRPSAFDAELPPALPEIIDEGSEASWILWCEATGTPIDWEQDTQPLGLSDEGSVEDYRAAPHVRQG